VAKFTFGQICIWPNVRGAQMWPNAHLVRFKGSSCGRWWIGTSETRPSSFPKTTSRVPRCCHPSTQHIYIHISIYLSFFHSLSLSLYIYMCVYVNVCIYPSIHMYTYERDTAKYLSEDDVKGAKVLPPISTRFELSLDVLSLRSDIMSSK